MNYFIAAATWLTGLWLIRRDTARRDGVSAATWIPTLWLGILASRRLSGWLGIGGTDTLEGSPVDGLFFLVMIAATMVVLLRRNVDWAYVVTRNWPMFLFYGFLLISVTWANVPTVSAKRWFKEFGNIAVALVVLTEANPLQAFRAVFVRCAYLLIPLSIVYIRYFPNLGRTYGVHSGMMEVTGVTTQKNSLGAMVLVCGLVFLWDWLERKESNAAEPRLERWCAYALAAAGLWLLYQSDSKTSMLCLVVGGTILSAVRLPVFRSRVSALGGYMLLVSLGILLADRLAGVSTTIVEMLGRDMTFTGRTDVWRALLSVNTDPLLGTGFMSFWDDQRFRSQLPLWVAFSAHNGYLEIYLAGGIVGVTALAGMLLGTGVRINHALASGSRYSVARFSIFVVTLIANFSESNFACMTPLGFIFIIAAMGEAPCVPQVHYAGRTALRSRRDGSVLDPNPAPVS